MVGHAGFQARSRDLRGGRWSWTLKFAQKRSWVGRWNWAEQIEPLLRFELSKLFINSSATDIVFVTVHASTAVETANAQCTSRWAMARGHRLNTSSIVLAAVHGLSGLFRAVSAVEPSLCRLLPTRTLSPSLICHLASVDVKQHEKRKVVGSHSSGAVWESKWPSAGLSVLTSLLASVDERYIEPCFGISEPVWPSGS